MSEETGQVVDEIKPQGIGPMLGRRPSFDCEGQVYEIKRLGLDECFEVLDLASDTIRSGAFGSAAIGRAAEGSIGMAVAAHKFRGIRATPCWNLSTASISRRHNDSNCLALGGRVLTREEAVAIVEAWLEAPFEGGRHERRVGKISALESVNFRNRSRRKRHVLTER